jgi:hypothetical protein
MTLKIRADGLGVIVIQGRVEGQVVLCYVLALVKCTMINFSWANIASCFLSHPNHLSWMLCSVLQLSSVVLPKARAFTSSTKPVYEDGRVVMLQASTRLALLNRKRMDKSGKLWGRLVWVGKALVL